MLPSVWEIVEKKLKVCIFLQSVIFVVVIHVTTITRKIFETNFSFDVK